MTYGAKSLLSALRMSNINFTTNEEKQMKLILNKVGQAGIHEDMEDAEGNNEKR